MNGMYPSINHFLKLGLKNFVLYENIDLGDTTYSYAKKDDYHKRSIEEL